MSILKDGFYKDLGVLSNNYVLLAAGGHMQFGNSYNNIPFSNNILNSGLYAQFADIAKSLPKAIISSGTTATTLNGRIYGIAGSTTSGSRIPTRWYANLETSDTELKDGMIIAIRMPTVGLGTVGECLTIDGDESHFHQIVYNTNSFLTTHFGINTVLLLQYDASISASMYGKYDSNTGKYVHNGNTQTSVLGVWRVLSLYDSGNTDVRYQQSIYYVNSRTVPSDGAICRYTLCMMTKEGKMTSLTLTNNSTATTKTMYFGYLDPRKVFYYGTTTTYAANANIGIYGNAYLFSHFGDLIDYRYTFNCGTTLTARSNFYIVGTIDENGFKLDSTQPWSCSLPTSEDGKVYIYVGMVYTDASGYRGTLEEVNTAYIYKDGSIKVYSGYSEVSYKLLNSRKLYVNLSNHSEQLFNGSADAANIGVYGSLGTSYGGTGNTSFTANRMLYTESATKMASATSIYATTTTLSINKTSAPANSGNFQVVGTSTMRTILPETDLTYNLGSATLRWLNIYGNVLRLQGASSNPSATGGARIEFSYDSGSNRLQPIYISYTPNDSYRAPGGLKIFGGTDATPAWLEVEGQIISDVAVGTAPFIITSTTLNTNLNADYLDGYHASSFSLTTHNHDTLYVKLDAGTTEQTIKNSIASIANGSIEIWRAVSGGYPMIGFATGTTKTKLGMLGFGATANVPIFRNTSGTNYNILHHGNTGLYVGGSGNLTANAAQSTNGNVYLTLKASDTYFKHKIAGGTGISVTSDGSGNITITNTQPDVNHNTDEKVTQTATTTNANYEILFSGTADNTTRTEGTRKTDALIYNPASKLLTNDGNIRIKGNHEYLGAASGSQVHLQYDDTLKCINFIFD